MRRLEARRHSLVPRAQGEPAALRPSVQGNGARPVLMVNVGGPSGRCGHTGSLFTQQTTPDLGAAPEGPAGRARPPRGGDSSQLGAEARALAFLEGRDVSGLPRLRGACVAATASSSDSPGRACWRKTPATRTASPGRGAAAGRRSRGFRRAAREEHAPRELPPPTPPPRQAGGAAPEALCRTGRAPVHDNPRQLSINGHTPVPEWKATGKCNIKRTVHQQGTPTGPLLWEFSSLAGGAAGGGGGGVCAPCLCSSPSLAPGLPLARGGAAEWQNDGGGMRPWAGLAMWSPAPWAGGPGTHCPSPAQPSPPGLSEQTAPSLVASWERAASSAEGPRQPHPPTADGQGFPSLPGSSCERPGPEPGGRAPAHPEGQGRAGVDLATFQGPSLHLLNALSAAVLAPRTQTQASPRVTTPGTACGGSPGSGE